MKTIFWISTAMLCLMLGCSNGGSDNKMARNEAVADMAAPSSISTDSSSAYRGESNGIDPSVAISSSAAVENKADSSHRFIRTADIKFKAKNVIKTTYQIEDITRRMGGFVEETKLASNIDYTNNVKISEDSSLELIYYTVVNRMTLRVPNTLLDSTLKSIAPLIDYLDYRTIKAEDVALKLMANKFAQKRAERHKQRVSDAVDEKGKKVSEIVNAEESITAKQEQADNAVLSNLQLQDKIAYSTISLDIYQRQEVKREMVANDKNIDAYRPSLFTRIGDAFKNGWDMVAEFIIGVVNLWGFILLASVLFIGVRMLLRWNRNSAQKQ